MSKKAALIEKHSKQYGLNIASRNTKGCVKSIVCLFCQLLGREDGGNDNGGSVRKRNKTTNVKY